MIYNRLNFFKMLATFSSVLLRVLNASRRVCNLLRFSEMSSSIFLTLSSKGRIIVRLFHRANHIVLPHIDANTPMMQSTILTRRSNWVSTRSNCLFMSSRSCFTSPRRDTCPSSSRVSLSTISRSLICGDASTANAGLSQRISAKTIGNRNAERFFINKSLNPV